MVKPEESASLERKEASSAEREGEKRPRSIPLLCRGAIGSYGGLSKRALHMRQAREDPVSDAA